MDTFLIIIASLFMVLGLVGSFLPILPGPLTSWLGLLIIHFTDSIPFNWTFLIITFLFAIVIWVLDYFIPAIGAKKFGGTKYGMIGATIGLFIGLFSPIPEGIIIGPFLGALIGELLHDTNFNKALKAAFGSFIGFLTSALLKFTVAIIYFGLFIYEVLSYKDVLWS
jgi:uncharacterized protein YqgC (DUF456 family)